MNRWEDSAGRDWNLSEVVVVTVVKVQMVPEERGKVVPGRFLQGGKWWKARSSCRGYEEVGVEKPGDPRRRRSTAVRTLSVEKRFSSTNHNEKLIRPGVNYHKADDETASGWSHLLLLMLQMPISLNGSHVLLASSVVERKYWGSRTNRAWLGPWSEPRVRWD